METVANLGNICKGIEFIGGSQEQSKNLKKPNNGNFVSTLCGSCGENCKYFRKQYQKQKYKNTSTVEISNLRQFFSLEVAKNLKIPSEGFLKKFLKILLKWNLQCQVTLDHLQAS